MIRQARRGVASAVAWFSICGLMCGLLGLLVPIPSGATSLVGRESPCFPNPYPVYWNVQGTGNDSAIATQYAYLPGQLTYTGGMGGLWPTISTSGKPNHGGVPQNGNLTAHLAALRAHIAARIPENFTGNAIFDFESWTNVWDQNTGSGYWHSKQYQTYSIQLMQQAHPSWSSSKAKSAAKTAFEAAATEWLVASLKAAKAARPSARWGYYGYPSNYDDCVFNVCGYNLPIVGAIYRSYSDKQQPIFDVSDALFPSVYIFKHLTDKQISNYISGTVKEALRVSAVAPARPPVYPFLMPQYHDLSAVLPSAAMQLEIEAPQQSGAHGAIMWGYEPKNTSAFAAYVRQTAGPQLYAFLKKLCGQ